MEPISVTGATESNPGLYILPIRYEGNQLVEFWQWIPAISTTMTSRWSKITIFGV